MATPGPDGRAPADQRSHERLSRLWWAAPGALVAGSAIGVAVVVGPTLGQQVSVPRELVVPATTSTPASAPPSPHATRHRPRHPSATPTPTQSQATVAIAPRTSVVQPRHQVVTASPEDSHEGHDDSGQESGDR
jgi:hypothetical protein